jgi:hypothetical protein
VIKIDGDVSLGNYDGFVNRYKEAGQFYTKNGLQKFGLVFVPLYDYISARSRESLTLSVSEYYIKVNDPDEAFRYLRFLRKEEFPAGNAREILMSAGKETAVKDFASHPDQDPVKLAEKYTEGDEWFVTFVKSYLKEWKRLKSEDGR